MVTRFPWSEGHFAAASVMWWARRRSIASRLSRTPVMVGKSGSVGAPGCSLSQPLRTAVVAGTSGVRRSFYLAERVYVGAGGEGDVLAGEPGEFGDPQPGLDGQREDGMVAPSGPCGQFAGVEQRVDLGLGEVGDEVALGSLGRDGEHALDGAGVLGVLQGKVAEQRVDRSQPVIASGGAVAPLALEMVQERADQRRVEFGDVEGGGCLAQAFRGEGQQEPEGELVGADRVRAGGPLADQPVGEVGLQCGGEAAHRRAPNCVCSRSAASSISCGDADRYQ